MARKGTRIVTRGSNFGRSRRIKSVGTTIASHQKGSTPPGSTWNEVRQNRARPRRRSKAKGGQ